MSAHNIIPAKIVKRESISSNKAKQPVRDTASAVTLGIILLILAIVIMSAALIFMCLSGSAGETVLLAGIAPFIAIFMLLILSK